MARIRPNLAAIHACAGALEAVDGRRFTIPLCIGQQKVSDSVKIFVTRATEARTHAKLGRDGIPQSGRSIALQAVEHQRLGLKARLDIMAADPYRSLPIEQGQDQSRSMGRVRRLRLQGDGEQAVQMHVGPMHECWLDSWFGMEQCPVNFLHSSH